MKRPTRVDRPPTDWARITSSQEEWRQFCWRVGMRFVARAATRVRDEGQSIAEAVNATIAGEAAEMRSDGAPEGLVAQFVADYSEARAHQMALVSDMLEGWRKVDEIPVTKTGLRKKPRQPRRSSGERAPT